jgi:chemotaxis protein MotB
MKHIMMIAALLCAAACVSPAAHRKLQGENGALKAHIANLAEQHRALAARAGQLESENQDLGVRAADADWIEQQKKKIADLLTQYGEGSPTQVPGVELVSTREGYAFRVAGEVLFAPGQTTLSEGGKRTLTEVAKSLNNRLVRVEGHTDDTPIKRSRWGTNLRLSSERALSVADFLISTGMPASNVGVAGYGEHRPAVAETTEAARKTNRRVEILMLNP